METIRILLNITAGSFSPKNDSAGFDGIAGLMHEIEKKREDKHERKKEIVGDRE